MIPNGSCETSARASGWCSAQSARRGDIVRMLLRSSLARPIWNVTLDFGDTHRQDECEGEPATMGDHYSEDRRR